MQIFQQIKIKQVYSFQEGLVQHFKKINLNDFKSLFSLTIVPFVRTNLHAHRIILGTINPCPLAGASHEAGANAPDELTSIAPERSLELETLRERKPLNLRLKPLGLTLGFTSHSYTDAAQLKNMEKRHKVRKQSRPTLDQESRNSPEIPEPLHWYTTHCYQE